MKKKSFITLIIFMMTVMLILIIFVFPVLLNDTGISSESADTKEVVSTVSDSTTENQFNEFYTYTAKNKDKIDDHLEEYKSFHYPMDIRMSKYTKSKDPKKILEKLLKGNLDSFDDMIEYFDDNIYIYFSPGETHEPVSNTEKMLMIEKFGETDRSNTPYIVFMKLP